MGNCQAAEVATVVIQHPGNNKVERIYWSVSAHEIMNSNPGHYVAMLVTSPTLKNENGLPLKQLKLLRPDDTLLIGQVYRLISFEDVLKEFAAKKCVKLGELLKENGRLGMEVKRRDSDATNSNSNPLSESGRNFNYVEEGPENRSSGSTSSSRDVVMRQYGTGRGQWKPALQSISEIGT